MFGEYKLIAYGIIGLALFGIGTTAVLSYNHYVGKSARQEEQIKRRDGVINDQQAIVADQKHQSALAKQYQVEADQRRMQSETRLKQILSMESKRDEKGNITADDLILLSLNSMYPGAKAGQNKADPPPRTAVPQSPHAAGDLAGGKDLLPE